MGIKTRERLLNVLILIGAKCFAAVYTGIGALELIKNYTQALQLSPILIIIGRKS